MGEIESIHSEKKRMYDNVVNKLDQEIQSLLQDCTIGGHQASLSCLCQGARHILLINCDLTLLWLHIIGRHLGTGHGYHGASHIMLAAGPKYMPHCRHTLSTRD